MHSISKRELLTGAGALAATMPFQARAHGTARAFRPGEVWLDTAGQPIQAHGGSIFVADDTFYWYGENKEKTIGDGAVQTWGIRCYSSKDLYNWDDIGLIIPPNIDDKSSPLHPTSKLERPHIIYNAQTKKFVCWAKVMERNNTQTRVVLISDKLTGPYEIVHQGMLPLGMSAGDFDLVVSPDDGKAYMYFERVHSELICADLTNDYTDFSGYYSTHFPRRGPPHVREAPAYFRRNGKSYLATSGTTGYFPNPSEIAVADTYHGPWKVLGDLHPSDRSRTSFNSQISSVFKHPKKKDLYIALGDQWMGPMSGPRFTSGALSTTVQSFYEKRFVTHQPMSPAEAEYQEARRKIVATSQSRYVWLPIQFKNERPFIAWRASWSLDEFA